MARHADIHKAAGIIIRGRRLLVERSKDKTHFIAPGGSVEAGETVAQALVRELMEEFSIVVTEDSLKTFGVFYAEAAGRAGKTVRMDVFSVTAWQGEPTPSAEVEELRWITSVNEEHLPLGSIFEHEVIPRLKAANLID
jgi:8-oxo-dGTP pyrophosphatase MutT (NUDIX family)